MALAPGTRLGPYEILGLIGAGGMGEVYRARDTRLMRRVAIKVLPAGLADTAEWRRRFEREARLISTLAHPNICTLYDVGRQDAVDFLVMEHLEGETLAARLTRGALPIQEVLDCAIAIADALDHAHHHGIVHRDLKPANVMLTPIGPKLLDFGLAMRPPHFMDPLIGDRSGAQTVRRNMTERGVVLGTFSYMAPEQLEGRDADARTDLFAFGAVVYEMTTGRRAFDGSSQARVIAATLGDDPPPLSHTAPQAPPEFEHVVRRCLAKEAADRWQTARDVAVELRSIAAARHEHRGMRSTIMTRRRGAVVAVAVIATALIVLGRDRIISDRWFGRVLSTHRGAIQSLAVLPLRNLSRDPEEQYFADGMTEALITDLSKLGISRVISRSSVIRFKDTEKPVRDVARVLNVDGVVEGAVLRAGDRVRITAALVEGRTGEEMWADAYDRDVHDVLALQADVARAIAAQIGNRVTGQLDSPRPHRTPVDDKAHDLYLKGRFAWQQWTAEGAQKGIDLFKAVLELDPAYPLAYSGLAEAYYGLSNVYMAPSDVMPRAKAAALKAIELDESLAEPHAVLGIVKMGFDWDWPGAEREFMRAIQLNPSYATAHQWYTLLLVSLGRFVEASTEARLGQQLDPMTRMVDIYDAWPLLYAREYEQALQKLKKIVALEPEFYATHAHLGIALLQLRRFDEALAEFETARALDKAPWISGWLGHAYGIAGRRAEALRVLTELTERSKREYVLPYAIAIVHTGLGHVDLALDWLEEAYRKRDEQLVMLAVDPAVDVLRPSPRFQDLLRRVGLTAAARAVPFPSGTQK
jgi:serine/threonine protein kinase/tetratricopeptide (TPR) repeat protein